MVRQVEILQIGPAERHAFVRIVGKNILLRALVGCQGDSVFQARQEGVAVHADPDPAKINVEFGRFHRGAVAERQVAVFHPGLHRQGDTHTVDAIVRFNLGNGLFVFQVTGMEWGGRQQKAGGAG
jgi:hypothetical protein